MKKILLKINNVLNYTFGYLAILYVIVSFIIVLTCKGAVIFQTPHWSPIAKDQIVTISNFKRD